MTTETHRHRWVNRQPCECGDTGPADVFAFLDSRKGKAWAAQPEPFVTRSLNAMRCVVCGHRLDDMGGCDSCAGDREAAELEGWDDDAAG